MTKHTPPHLRSSRRFRSAAARASALIVLIASLAAMLAAAPSRRAHAAVCTSTTVVVIAHPDDALAFIHDNVRWQRQTGNCVHIVSLTSHYDDKVAITGREEGARAAYQLLLDPNASDDTPQHYNTAIRQQFGARTLYRMFIHGTTGNPSLTLSFYRLPASTYPGKTVGSIYDVRNDPSLIASLRSFLEYYRPSKVYTLNTAGRLVDSVPCTTQDGGMIGANECDHYDHVGTAIVTRAAVASSNVPTTLYEFRGYDLAAGRAVDTDASHCAALCAMLRAYLAYDVAAAATPWGSLLPVADQPVRSTAHAGTNLPVFADRRIRTSLSASGCIAPRNGATTNLTPIVVLPSCTNAPTWALTRAGELRVGGKCAESGTSMTSAPVFLFECQQGPHQQWTYDSGARTLVQRRTGLRLDLPNSTTTAGTVLHTFPGTGAANQCWIVL